MTDRERAARNDIAKIQRESGSTKTARRILESIARTRINREWRTEAKKTLRELEKREK